MRVVQGLSKAFGKVIAEIRAKRGISQEQLAEAIDSTNVYISLLENGLRKPSLNSTILIAQSLEIQPDVLVKQVIALLEQEDAGNVDRKEWGQIKSS
jgi:transcriptional regulator with XRE-family HTH domain